MRNVLSLSMIALSVGEIYGAISSCYKDNHGWIFDKYCLEIVLTQTSWHSARNYCANRGGDLVEVRTPQMQNSIASHLRIYNGRYNGFWIGASDSESEGWWRWLHNPRGMSWSYWSPGEGPNHGFLFGGYPDDCALIRVDQNFRWYDSPCDGVVDALHYSFICQYVMVSTTHTNTNITRSTNARGTRKTTGAASKATSKSIPSTTDTTADTTSSSLNTKVHYTITQSHFVSYHETVTSEAPSFHSKTTGECPSCMSEFHLDKCAKNSSVCSGDSQACYLEFTESGAQASCFSDVVQCYQRTRNNSHFCGYRPIPFDAHSGMKCSYCCDITTHNCFSDLLKQIVYEHRQMKDRFNDSD